MEQLRRSSVLSFKFPAELKLLGNEMLFQEIDNENLNLMKTPVCSASIMYLKFK